MTYFVWIRDKNRGASIVWESLLDGLVGQHVIDAMTCEVADDLGLCRICDSGGCRCHVMVAIGHHTYAKYCPVLWHDVFRPKSWTVDVLT